MRHISIRRALVTITAATALTPALLAISATSASATTTGDIASLALANAGKGAGWCSQSNSANNSLGGNAFGSSCDNSSGTGNGEFWCADFAKWVWQNANGGTINTTGLTPGAGSFYTYGQSNNTLHTSTSYVPQVGDAVVYNYVGNGSASHVGLVTAVNSDGSVQTANGDFGGATFMPNSQTPSTQAYFSETSTVVMATLGASERSVGSTPSSTGMTISAYITPIGLTTGGSTSSGRIYALAPDKSAVSVYNGTGTGPGAWTVIGGAATALYAGGDGLFAVNPNDGSINEYNGTPNSWTKIGGPAASFAVTANHIYGLASDKSAVSVYNGTGTGPGAWTVIGGAATAIYAGGNGLFAVNPNDGSINEYNGAPNSWTKIGGPAASFAVTGNHIYGLASDKSAVSVYNGTGTGPGAWTVIGGAASQLAATD